MKHILNKYLILLCILFIANNSNGENHYWLTYTKQVNLSDTWQWNTRLGVRHYDTKQDNIRWGASPSLQGKFNKINWMLASRFFYYKESLNSNYIETRPWLGIAYKHSTQLSQQVKWEHRMYNNEKTNISRIRYRFKWQTTLLKKRNKTIQIGFSPEAFWSIEQSQNAEPNAIRWIIPLTYKTQKHWQVQLAPFLQTNGFDFNTNTEDYLLAFRLNIKSF